MKEKEKLTDYIIAEMTKQNFTLYEAMNYLEYLKEIIKKNTVIVKKDEK